MGVISEEYIMRRLKEYVKDAYYSNAPAGTGSAPTSKAHIEAMLQEICDKFIAVVKDVIPSFRGSGVHAFINSGADDKGTVRASISVDEDALQRESLHYMNKDLSIGHGEGVRDILALFTHGYTLSKRPYGFWVKDGGLSMERIGARIHREPNPFLSDFVQRMNAEYAGRCVLTLNNKYITQGGG